jgi:23S rRNA (pseudouridine1915-N3)-methyltransferase
LHKANHVKVRIIAVGRPAAGPMRDAIAEYERRAAKYWPLDVGEVRAEPARSRSTDEVRRLEGARLLEKASGVIVALDERGRSMSTEVFARWMTDRRDRAEDMTFLIGGAFGLDTVVRDRASLVLSLSPWTLPHEMARLILAEQLYRAGTIQRGEPYHKGG